MVGHTVENTVENLLIRPVVKLGLKISMDSDVRDERRAWQENLERELQHLVREPQLMQAATEIVKGAIGQVSLSLVPDQLSISTKLIDHRFDNEGVPIWIVQGHGWQDNMINLNAEHNLNHWYVQESHTAYRLDYRYSPAVLGYSESPDYWDVSGEEVLFTIEKFSQKGSMADEEFMQPIYTVYFSEQGICWLADRMPQ